MVFDPEPAAVLLLGFQLVSVWEKAPTDLADRAPGPCDYCRDPTWGSGLHKGTGISICCLTPAGSAKHNRLPGASAWKSSLVNATPSAVPQEAAYLTWAKSSAGDLLHWHSFAKGTSVEWSGVGTGPWSLLPAPTTPGVAVWPLGPWWPASINCKTQTGFRLWQMCWETPTHKSEQITSKAECCFHIVQVNSKLK